MPEEPRQPHDFDGARVTVMGLGRFGGGLGVARWLAARGADVLVTDTATPDDLATSVAALNDLVAAGSVRLRLGEHNVRDFTTCDLVVANPAVACPWDNRFLRAAEAAGIAMTTEIRLVTERLDRRRVIGVTGSTGKSTTSAMIHHALTRAGLPSVFGGNIGGSLLGTLETITPATWVVLELSSAQLHWLGAGVGEPDAPGYSPHIAILTNIEPNHIDWHGTFEHYRAAKHNIFRYQQPGDHRITGDVDELHEAIELAIPGAHNQRNAMTAMTAARLASGLAPEDTAPLLADFSGLPHRLQHVPGHAAGHRGRTFYNDSKATTPAATLLAVGAFDPTSRVHLIAGGYDKKVDLSSIADMSPRIAGLYTIGATGPVIAGRARALGAANVFECETLERAVAAALPRMGDEHVLLLSPGCASWDQFSSYEQRGETFIDAVQSYPSACRSSSSSPK